jgi:hypothetical protein
MKYILAICLVIITFLALRFIYTEDMPQDTTYTITVPKECTLNEVVAGEDYLFDCPGRARGFLPER